MENTKLPNNQELNQINYDEMIILIKKAQQNDREAKESLMKINRGLIYKIVYKFQDRSVSLDDLIQDAYIGLLKAIESFDIDKGYKFSTYAAWQILGEIKHGITNQSKTIKMPFHVNYIYRLKNIEDDFIYKNGYRPYDEEICEIYNKIYPQEPINIDKIKTLRIFFNDTLSLNNKINSEITSDQSEIIDYLKDDTKTTEEIALDNIQFETIRKIISGDIKTKLTEQQKIVLRYRFGFNNENILTLQEIGEILGVTKERVRQIELSALKKLSKNPALLGIIVEKNHKKKLVK